MGIGQAARLSVVALGLGVAACARQTAIGPDTPAGGDARGGGSRTLDRDEGLATWYGPGFDGKKTASGERFDSSKMTAAHRTLKFGTWLEVTREDTGQSVRVRVTDRGPFGDDRRILDLSKGAADKLGMLRAGVVRVKLRIVDGP